MRDPACFATACVSNYSKIACICDGRSRVAFGPSTGIAERKEKTQRTPPKTPLCQKNSKKDLIKFCSERTVAVFIGFIISLSYTHSWTNTRTYVRRCAHVFFRKAHLKRLLRPALMKWLANVIAFVNECFVLQHLTFGRWRKQRLGWHRFWV